jgi:hypothetical protein
MLKDIPFLPGHRFSDPYKQNFHKEQIFKLQTKTCLGKLYFNNKIRETEIHRGNRPIYYLKFIFIDLHCDFRQAEKQRNKI